MVLSATNANQLSFLAQSNLTYSVQWKSNLTSGLWTNLTNIGGQTGVRTIVVDTASAPAPAGPERYWRVVTPSGP